jgi:hypothetical protein
VTWLCQTGSGCGLEQILRGGFRTSRDVIRGFTGFPRNHKLERYLDSVGAHPHRFRKTIARLAVLALVGAPMILQDIFGHSELQSLLKYILANPDIRAEIVEMAEQTSKDQAHLVAEDLDLAGGRASKVLRSERDRFFDALHVPRNERAQKRRIHEFAESVIADGSRDLKFVYPGIVCTKAKSAKGNCSSDAKMINPSACETICQFFLALGSGRPNTRLLIDWLMSELESPAIASNPLLTNLYRAQLYDQVRVYEDVKEEYLTNARYVAIMSAIMNLS